MQKRIEKLRGILEEKNIEAFIILSPFNRRYMTQFTGTSGAVLITSSEALFITDFRYMDQANEQISGYTIIEHKASLEEAITKELQRLQVKRLGFEQDQVTYAAYQRYKQHFKLVELVPISGLVESLRMLKDESEIALIQKAVDIVDQTYEHILRFIKPGMKELEVELELQFHMRKLGSTGPSFDIIVASGARSALPHGVASDKVIEKGDFVTLDFGATYQGYLSDMTRTFAMGEPKEELKKIYDICLQAQLLGVQKIKAGMTSKEADAICRDYIKDKGYGDYFGHSTGHAIGLEIHESPALSMRSDAVLHPGMVVTVEPGIYLSGVGGVRIEDDIVITATGNNILTKSSKELIIID